MPSILNIFLPPLIFFFAFFIAFSLIELLTIFLLGYFEDKYWAFVIDTVIRAKVHHGRMIEICAAIGLLLLVVVVLFLTPIIEILATSKSEFQPLIFGLIVVMILIYMFTTRRMVKMDLEKKVHGYIYFVLSIIFFAVVVIVADSTYESYQDYMTTNFIAPTTQKIQSGLSAREERKILNQFRNDLVIGKCTSVNYNEEQDGVFRHFIYVTTDKDFAESKLTALADNMPDLIGKKCTDGEHTFLLNEEGRWYWVILEPLI